jgi:hypothetical protein
MILEINIFRKTGKSTHVWKSNDTQVVRKRKPQKRKYFPQTNKNENITKTCEMKQN